MKKIIISPSGNLYGSENVLFDYLNYSNIEFETVYVPRNSQFHSKLKKAQFRTKPYQNLLFLYFELFLRLLTEKIDTVYCNEGGHIRYIELLASTFQRINFVIHIRINEDVNRAKSKRKNIKFISISRTIFDGINIGNLIYDGYNFELMNSWNVLVEKVIKVGIVGRITLTKGIGFFTQEFIDNCGSLIEFHFYGDIDNDFKQSKLFEELISRQNISFHGFFPNKDLIYKNVDVILHLNENEPLGRIFFESIDFGVPFIGVNSGGIGEIASIIDYPYVYNQMNISLVLYGLSNNRWSFDLEQLQYARENAIKHFSINNYSKEIDKLLS